jgi:hypothetical protein
MLRHAANCHPLVAGGGVDAGGSSCYGRLCPDEGRHEGADGPRKGRGISSPEATAFRKVGFHSSGFKEQARSSSTRIAVEGSIARRIRPIWESALEML